MDNISKLKVTGEVTFRHYNARGNLINLITVPNLIVTTGLNHIAGRMSNTGTAPQMTHMALGSSLTTPALGDTALGSQLGSRKALTVAGGTLSNNTITYAATFIAGEATGAVVEAGIFNSASGVLSGLTNAMMCRTVFPVINKGSADSLAVTWVVTVSASA